MATLIFALQQYAQLTVFVVACWGWGRIMLRPCRLSPSVGNPLAVALGMGGAICALQALAIAGLLYPAAVLALVGTGLLSATHAWRHASPAAAQFPPRRHTPAEWMVLALIALMALPLMVSPLSPPHAWDELMYHLPHAREWALGHGLQVSDWLRYPWFPYNFDLLFAAALTLGNDILPHLLHATAGGIVAWLIYRLGTQYLHDRLAAGAAVVIWLILSRSLYSSAYVDMGVAMLILAAFLAMQLWLDSGTSTASRDRRWAFACAFLVGVAAGSKYQTLTLLPLLALILAWHDRRPGTWLGCIALLLLPSLYWYARNAIATGDPFNPAGGRIFGFSDWNPTDYQVQLQDLQRVAKWPNWAVWPAFASPLIPALRRQPVLRNTMLVAGYMVLVWAATSRYPRYLMPAYPLLALLAAAVLLHAGRQAEAWLQGKGLHGGRWAYALVAVLCVAQGLLSSHDLRKNWKNVAATDTERESFLARRIAGYGVWKYLRAHPEAKVYQFGLEDAIYYAPRPIWGEVFGPWRYQDFDRLAPQALHRKLQAQGFTAVVIHTKRIPQVNSRAGFDCYFTPLHADGAVRLYRLTPLPGACAPEHP